MWSEFSLFSGFYSGPWSQRAIDVPASGDTVSPDISPKKSAQTGQQSVLPPSSPLNFPLMDSGNAYAIGGFADTNSQTSAMTTLEYTNGRIASTYRNYRQFRKDPIVAIGREMADCLICTNKWAYEAKEANYSGGDEKLDEMIAFVRDMWEGIAGFDSGMQPITFRELLLSESCWAKDYGNHTLEIVYGDAPDGGVTITGLLACLPENTSPLVVERTRKFAGVRNWSVRGGYVDLEPQYCVRFVYDGEGGDMFGRSRFENCMDYIQLKWDVREKIRTDLNTTIGNTMDVGFPMDSNPEVEAQNADKAAKIGIGLTRGQTVVRPILNVQDQLALIRNGIDPSKVSLYPINRLDTGENAAEGFKIVMDLLDEQILFGHLVLPRTVKEAEHGAKADAQEHTNSQEMFSERWISRVIGAAQLITDKILMLRYGEDARGAVRVKANPVDDEVKAILKDILTTLLQGNQELALRVVDIKAALSKLNIKTLSEFDQEKMAKALASKGAGDATSNREKLRQAGYNDGEADKVMKEKRDEDSVETDADMLGRGRTKAMAMDEQAEKWKAGECPSCGSKNVTNKDNAYTCVACGRVDLN